VARRTPLLGELGAEIERDQGPRPLLITQDVLAADAAIRLRDAALAGFGSVDVLVNCAGGSRPLPVDAPEERWEEAIALNFTRQRQVANALLLQMIERRWGRIINITGKSEPDRLNAAFSAKAAVDAWAKGLSREIGKYGITVNSIPPGRIMSEQIRRNYPEEYRKSHAVAEIPAGAYGEPEDLAALAVFLASPVAHYISGAVIPVDGAAALRVLSRKILTTSLSVRHRTLGAAGAPAWTEPSQFLGAIEAGHSSATLDRHPAIIHPLHIGCLVG
jgi:3-oxoacyl-[acyl-carrier protein] reductase